MKLELTGFRGSDLKLLVSYFDTRYQYIGTDSFQTKTKMLSFGVPQRSIPGPFLIIRYSKDLQIVTENTGILLYADGTVPKFKNNKD